MIKDGRRFLHTDQYDGDPLGDPCMRFMSFARSR